MKKGYVHVYTGNGKGKTTAAVGLIVRAAAAGKRVYMGQFMKDKESGEIAMLRERFPEVSVELYGGGLILSGEPSEEDLKRAAEGMEKARKAVSAGEYDMVVLDEINVAVFLELVPLSDILALINEKPEGLELVLTGRYAHKDVISAAALVSEIAQVKHYFNDGVPARHGIEL